jgi:hypothetical protein
MTLSQDMLVARLGIVAATIAALASPAVAGAPVRLIREIRIHANVPQTHVSPCPGRIDFGLLADFCGDELRPGICRQRPQDAGGEEKSSPETELLLSVDRIGSSPKMGTTATEG